jgi:GT2 family glycosyltransferase
MSTSQQVTRIYKPPLETTIKGSGIGVVIVNYCTAEFTLECIESFRENDTPPDWIVVIDNSPTDELSVALQKTSDFRNTEIILLFCPGNHGFAQGCNLGISELTKFRECKYIQLINSDAIALPKLLSTLRSALIENPEAGIVGANVNCFSNPNKIESAGLTLYRNLIPGNRVDFLDGYLGPTGACMMLTRACIDRLNNQYNHVFDPIYFCYCEDADLAIRCRELGMQPVHIPLSLVLHRGQKSTARRPDFIPYYAARNSVYFLFKNFRAVDVVSRLPGLTLSLLGFLLFDAINNRQLRSLKGILDSIILLALIQRSNRSERSFKKKNLKKISSRHFYHPNFIKNFQAHK